MKFWLAAALCLGLASPAAAASDREPAPAGSFPGAPPQFTKFTADELTRGFLALAFGSDLRIGARPKGVRRFDRPIRAVVVGGGSVDRVPAMQRVLFEYGEKVPNLHLSVGGAVDGAEITVRLIDEKNFGTALEAAFGREVARAFVAKTDPQCMTNVQSDPEGRIIHSESFIIVDKGDDVFLDCAYHELLHAFGLSNHDQRNPWTTLNQNRMVGYLSVYDRALLTLLYDSRLSPGMTRDQVNVALPQVIRSLGLAGPK
ncbi:MAG: DUF2927 domain-containing protein [Pseudolabrys sp.]|nr:DUF2927 domain-containing protein [Pseudolabrys sp.]